jgi:hypothetical protein
MSKPTLALELPRSFVALVIRKFGKFKLRLLAVVVFLVFAPLYAAAQASGEVVDPVRTSNCEFISSKFDNLIQATAPTKKIIVIAFNGEGEKQAMATRRLHNAKTYAIEAYRNSRVSRTRDSVVVATGVDIRQNGELEIYVDGVLSLSVVFLKDRDLRLSPCHLELDDYCRDAFKKLFYPCIRLP